MVEEILDYQVDGIIAASVAMSSDLSLRCRAAGVPLVLFTKGGGPCGGEYLPRELQG